MAHVLYGVKGNKNIVKCLIAAEYSGLKLDLAPGFEFGKTNTTPEFLKKNPMGQVPVLETPYGILRESNAIAAYAARYNENALLGTTLFEKAQVDQWVHFAAAEFHKLPLMILEPSCARFPHFEEVEKVTIQMVKKSLGALNIHLSSQTFLVGHAVTLADIILTCNLYLPIRDSCPKEFTADYPHVERYFWTMVNQPNFKKWMGEVKQVSQAEFLAKRTTVKPTESVQGQPQRKSKSAEAAATSKPKQAVPVEKPKTKPAAAPMPTPLPDADEEEEDAAPKKSNSPLDFLPPSPMVLDNWKRLYSNTKAKEFYEVAIKGFWDMYDSEGYSLWFCDYKYNEENVVSYVTMNKVGGFLQRMDFIRKYAFGKMCILGSEPPFKIKGVWLFRGLEIPQQVKDDCYDVELYEWTKVDIADETQKNRVNAYFEEPDVIDGDKLVEAKCFK